MALKDEITYTPGRLARKLGVSKSKLMKHLRATGLIDQCYVTQHGHWQIPYSLAAKISSVEALNTPRQTMPRTHHGFDTKGYESLQATQPKGSKIASGLPRSSQRNQKVSPSFVNEPKPVHIPDYTQIGRSLRRAGVTMKDLLNYIEKEMGVTHENIQDNSAQRNDENPADESTTTSGSAGSNIPNSGEK